MLAPWHVLRLCVDALPDQTDSRVRNFYEDFLFWGPGSGDESLSVMDLPRRPVWTLLSLELLLVADCVGVRWLKMDGCASRGREVHGDEYHEWAMITEFAPADSVPLWVMQRNSLRSSAALVHRGYGVC